MNTCYCRMSEYYLLTLDKIELYLKLQFNSNKKGQVHNKRLRFWSACSKQLAGPCCGFLFPRGDSVTNMTNDLQCISICTQGNLGSKGVKKHVSFGRKLWLKAPQ
ncbi:hypothetical protein ATANTOWER_028238 [Ataeniobius toweri]|uniref:Uncharacterized protein n=1 Tax=Ataeniobius toweri TaxID=208326 RepID=A0ABU7BBJ5_9TELE|nr:hypothetical protein [Ataeniobius toweri]